MVNLRSGQRMRKEIGIKRKECTIEASFLEIREDLRLMGAFNSPPSFSAPKQVCEKSIDKSVDDSDAIDGLLVLLQQKDVPEEVVPLSQVYEENPPALQHQPMIYPQLNTPNESELDIIKSRNSSVHIRIGYTILAHVFLSQNWHTFTNN